MPAYTRTTWQNGVTPANAANMNNIESFLASLSDANISTNGAGQWSVLALALTNGSLTRIAMAGPYTVTTTSTFQNHGLSVAPDIIIPVIAGTSLNPLSVTWDKSTITSTQVKLQGNASITPVYLLSIKF